MGTSLEIEKTSNISDGKADELVTTKSPTWLTKITNFVAHWGVETNGSVILLGR